MEKLIDELKVIIAIKKSKLDAMVDDPNDDSSYATLEFEIEEASALVERLASDIMYEDKIDLIKEVRYQTTSGSVYKVLGDYLTSEGHVKYYFVSFMEGSLASNAVLHCHPIDWQIACSKSHPGQYVLLHWQEITKDEYDKVKEVK
jgi:hypothetical protein